MVEECPVKGCTVVWKELLSTLESNSSSEMDCNSNFTVLLLLKTGTVQICRLISFQCKSQIWLTGKVMKIGLCRVVKCGSKNIWT